MKWLSVKFRRTDANLRHPILGKIHAGSVGQKQLPALFKHTGGWTTRNEQEFIVGFLERIAQREARTDKKSDLFKKRTIRRNELVALTCLKDSVICQNPLTKRHWIINRNVGWLVGDEPPGYSSMMNDKSLQRNKSPFDDL